MASAPRKRAKYVDNHLKTLSKKYNDFKGSFRVNLRSSVFVSPEFEDKLDLSMCVLMNEKEDSELIKLFTEKKSDLINEKVLEVSPIDINNEDLDNVSINSNASMSFNSALSKVIAKVVVLIIDPRYLVEFDPLNAFESIKGDKENCILIEGDDSIAVVSMSIDHFYLCRGLDETIHDTNVGILDLVLRAELLGGKIIGKNELVSSPPAHSLKNVHKLNLQVNQGISELYDL